MSRKFNIIYLGLAPVLFFLSWYISHRLYERFMKFGSGDFVYQGKEQSLLYASFFTGVYLLAWFVMKDLYGRKKN
ncbi:MAG: hypothetical protein RL220_2075 [Bacteroidota bacterium]|jgi:hypothetical protein